MNDNTIPVAFFICAFGAVAVMGVADSCSAKGPPPPPPPVSSCEPCPTRADNAKLREAHAACDARAKTWEERARGVK